MAKVVIVATTMNMRYLGQVMRVRRERIPKQLMPNLSTDGTKTANVRKPCARP